MTNHTNGPFDPVYADDYHIVSMQGKLAEVIPASGGKTNKIHISDVKYVLPADNNISK